MKKNYLFGAIIILLMIMSYLPIYTLSYDKVFNLTKEDHVYENSQAIFFLLSAGLMFFLYIKSLSGGERNFFKIRGNIFFLLLGLYLFFCFGEEISWGQRIFGIQTPAYLEKVNAQGETNLHNLWLFSSYDKSEVTKTGLMGWITSARLFALSWMLYCVMIPVLNYLFSGIREFFKKINLPIVPLWIGFLFVLAHIISKLVQRTWLYPEGQPVTEIKEATFAFLFFIMSLSFFLKGKKITFIKGWEWLPKLQIRNWFSLDQN